MFCDKKACTFMAKFKDKMRQFTVTIFTIVLGSFASLAQCTDLFFSEYIEGSSSNKAIEIYNPTSGNIDLSDYKLYRHNSAAVSPTDSLFPVGIIAAGDVFVIGNGSGDPMILAESDTLHAMTFYNGDDALVLVKISTGQIIDIIGETTGTDPGTNWPVGSGATSEFTLVRKSNVQQGQPNWVVGANEWDAFPQNVFDSLGAHTMIACGTPCTPTASTISPIACDSYIAPDGASYTTTGTYTATLVNTQGCDSVITINLTVNNSTTNTISPVACGSYTLNGTTYNLSGVYTQMLSNAAGCDSIITLDLSITSIPNVTVNGVLDYCEGDTPTALTLTGGAATDSLIISGVMDATLPGGLPKVIEFYALEDISDLSAYGFGSANNGGGSDGEEYTFPAVSLTAGSYIHVATDSANFFNFMGFYPDYVVGNAANINGDDAIELFYNGAVIDVFGDINVDGTGQPWEYLDGWAYRKDNATPNGGNFVLGEWDFSGPNALDGESNNTSAATPFPAESYMYTAPSYTYEWYSSLGALLSSTETYTPMISSGSENYFVSASNVGDTTCSSQTIVTVSFNPAPMVLANASATTVCENENVTLSGSGAASYQWDNGVTDGVAFAANTTTDYIVIGTDTIGCTAADTVTITVTPAPAVAMTPLATVCVNEAAFTLTQGSPAGGTYSGTGVANGEFDPATAGVGTFTITYTFTDSTGCEGTATADIEVDGCVGLEELKNGGVVVYPNPASDVLNVKSNATITKIQVVDLSGMVVATSTSDSVAVATLAAGMYVLNITTETGTATKSFVKK